MSAPEQEVMNTADTLTVGEALDLLANALIHVSGGERSRLNSGLARLDAIHMLVRALDGRDHSDLIADKHRPRTGLLLARNVLKECAK